jgi:hypothetical protein
VLKKASEYQEHARECRQLARTAVSPEHKAMLEKMAQTWEALARERQQRIWRASRMSASERNFEGDQGLNP